MRRPAPPTIIAPIVHARTTTKGALPPPTRSLPPPTRRGKAKPKRACTTCQNKRTHQVCVMHRRSSGREARGLPESKPEVTLRRTLSSLYNLSQDPSR